MLNIDVINLGFAGNGWGEPEVAGLAGEIGASLFVLDYAANCDPARLRKTLPGFVRVLRQRHPETPILLVSCLAFSQYGFVADTRAALESKRNIMLEFYSAQRKRGEKNIHFADGFGLLPFGSDNALVDGVHPTNHGYAVISQRLAPIIEQILMHSPANTKTRNG
jgi:lysophospholipase L1-like esterase